ncbi:ABC transporter permease subunit [Paraneptunicella aestuarii]|uniref:ABC transporter permease subunit n=1 Tax=Paraneptunicella aestuarii TaxID=2831148 RepID=UPI001E4060DD|nr:ABC transporter permease subunit [Paraneptunicella aestuarii]UAA37985.1 ABC transporter permease subunit [Paraneptunicella aestuarii]
MLKNAIQKQQRRRIRKDRNAAWLIRLGGWTVLAALLMLLWHLLSVVLPIFKSPEIRATDVWQTSVPGQVLFFSKIHQSTLIVSQTDDCKLFVSQRREGVLATPSQQWQVMKRISIPCQDKVRVSVSAGVMYLAQLSDTHILRVSELTMMNDDVHQAQVYSTRLENLFFESIEDWSLFVGENKWAVNLKLRNGWQLYWLQPDDPLWQQSYWYANARQVVPMTETMTALVNMGSSLQYRSLNNDRLWEQYSNVPIQNVVPLPSSKSFVAIDDSGLARKWALANKEQLAFAPLYQLPVQGQFVQLLFHPLDMLGVLVDEHQITLFNTTTGEVLNEQSLSQLMSPVSRENLQDVIWLDRQLGFKSAEQIRVASIDNANAILTFRSLFLPIQYEGYGQPEYVWQSSSGADHHEPKYSVIPLIIGSIKAALIAMLVALPMGLGAAVYTAYFAPSGSRKWLKPAIEMLEAIPSVVIGFIAAVWLLPLPEEYLSGMISFVLLLPLFAFFLVWVNKLMQRFFGMALPMSLQFSFIYLLVFALFIGYLVPQVMHLMNWLHLPSIFFLKDMDTHSKNTIVVAMALGIAIAPSIYSLAEDAIFEVPSSLRRASYALGATRLQTLLNVVLKVAYPGILSALMLGFSRAIGETMILLMVTGNTPIAEWDLMSGMRTLTANLAIELPESEVGGIHYRVLFLTALLLLIFTMTINTVAELLRLRLRRKYRHE